MANHSTDADLVFAALADPTRRAVVQRLGSGPRSVGELARHFPIALPSFLKHITALERSGLIRTSKAGRVRSCELNRARLGVVEHWLDVQRHEWEAGTDRLQTFAEQEASTAGPALDAGGVASNIRATPMPPRSEHDQRAPRIRS